MNIFVSMVQGCDKKVTSDRPNSLIKRSGRIEVASHNIRLADIKKPIGPKLKPPLSRNLIRFANGFSFSLRQAQIR